MEHLIIENDGININYTDSKIGESVLLFIHGWGINQTYWQNQITTFKKSHRIVTIDLPGFGKSGKNRSSWTIDDYSKDITSVLINLDLKDVILIGHSMSGAIVVETALSNPSRISGIIGVDNFKDVGVVLTQQMKEENAAFYTAAKENFRETVSENMLQYLFASSTDAGIIKRVSDDILMSDVTIAIDSLENADSYSMSEKLLLLHKPICLINSDNLATETTFFKENKIDYTLFNIGPTGHYPMLEKPGEFNLLLQQAIEKIRNTVK